MLRPGKVLVTGGAGLLGRAVVGELLRHGYAVRVLDVRPGLSPEDVPSEGVEWMRGEIGSFEDVDSAVSGCESIVHLAALTSPQHPAHLLHRVNVIGTRHLIRAAARRAVKRFVHASSLAIYGMTFAPRLVSPRYLPIDELHGAAAQDIYGLSKLENEKDLAAFSRDYGGQTTSLRLAQIFDFDHMPATRLPDLSGRRPSSGLWGYLDLRDAARAFLLALSSEHPGHLAVNVVARDLLCEAEPRLLIERHFPHLTPFLAHYDFKNRGFWDTCRCETEFGFVPLHAWRENARFSPAHLWWYRQRSLARRIANKVKRLALG